MQSQDLGAVVFTCVVLTAHHTTNQTDAEENSTDFPFWDVFRGLFPFLLLLSFFARPCTNTQVILQTQTQTHSHSHSRTLTHTHTRTHTHTGDVACHAER